MVLFTKGMTNQYITHLKKCDIYPLKKQFLNHIFEEKNADED